MEMESQDEIVSLLIRRYQADDKDSVKALYYAGLDQFDADLRHDGYLILDEDLDDIENVHTRNKEGVLAWHLAGRNRGYWRT